MKTVILSLFLVTFANSCESETSPDYFACEDRIPLVLFHMQKQVSR